jgi:hypothetical protein
MTCDHVACSKRTSGSQDGTGYLTGLRTRDLLASPRARRYADRRDLERKSPAIDPI